MKRSAVILTATIGLLSISACTSQQRAMLDSAQESEPTAIVDVPTETTVYVVDIGTPAFPAAQSLNATVDCGGFTVRINGYPDGTLVEMGISGQQPFQFATTPGGDAGSLGVETTGAFTATIDLDGVRVFEQFADCAV